MGRIGIEVTDANLWREALGIVDELVTEAEAPRRARVAGRTAGDRIRSGAVDRLRTRAVVG